MDLGIRVIISTSGPYSNLEANLANRPREPIVEQGQSSIVANPKTFISTEEIEKHGRV